MSTRSSVYYEDDPDIHIYHELMDEDNALFMEYREGAFVVTFKIPARLAQAIELGLAGLPSK